MQLHLLAMLQRTQSDYDDMRVVFGNPLLMVQEEQSLMAARKDETTLVKLIEAGTDTQNASIALSEQVVFVGFKTNKETNEQTPLFVHLFPAELTRIIMRYISGENSVHLTIQVCHQDPRRVYDTLADSTVQQTTADGWVAMLGQLIDAKGNGRQVPVSAKVIFLCSEDLDRIQLDPRFVPGMEALRVLAKRLVVIGSDYGVPALCLLTGCPTGVQTGTSAQVFVVSVDPTIQKYLHPAFNALVMARQQMTKRKEDSVCCVLDRMPGTYTLGKFGVPWVKIAPNVFRNDTAPIPLEAHVIAYDGEYPLYVLVRDENGHIFILFGAHFCSIASVNGDIASQIAQQKLVSAGFDAKYASDIVSRAPPQEVSLAVRLALRTSSDTSNEFGGLVKTLSEM